MTDRGRFPIPKHRDPMAVFIFVASTIALLILCIALCNRFEVM